MRTARPRTRLLPLAACLALAACSARTAQPAPDARDDAAPAADVPDTSDATDATGAADVMAPFDARVRDDVQHVNTCAELHLDAVTSTPGHPGLGYPGARLALRGAGFGQVLTVVVGGVEMPFQRTDDAAIATRVPSMLAAGERTVVVQTERCSAAQSIVVSRLLAVVRAGDPQAVLLDATDLSRQGTVDLGSGTIVQAEFTFDGGTLVTRDVRGAVARTQLADGATSAISPTSNAAFGLSQATVQPTRGLLLVPGGSLSGVTLLDSALGTLEPYATPAAAPRSLSVSLDGFRAVLLDAAGAVYLSDRPFATRPAWAPLPGPGFSPGQTEVVLAQAPHAPGEHLAAVFAAGAAPTITPFNAYDGAVGVTTTLPAGSSRPRFISGDVVVFDTTTPEVVAVDITDLEGLLVTLTLRGEAPGAGLATRVATTLYTLGVLALRPAPGGGAASADVLHIVDFNVEPPEETGQGPVAGARGAVGIQGTGQPFVVWTAQRVVKVLGDTPDVAHQQALDLGAGGEIVLVAAQP